MAERHLAGGNPEPLIDRGAKPYTMVRVIILAVALLVAAAAFVVFKDRLDTGFVIILLGVFALIGIFFLVSAAIGFIQVAPRAQSDPVARGFLDGHPAGTLISDAKGRVVYANHAYGALTGLTKASEIQPIDAILTRHKEASEAVYRLTNALREGKSGREEFRLAKSLNPVQADEGPKWYRLTARAITVDGAPKQDLQCWQLTEVTKERDDQELFFKQLQHAIDYLDHAPAGFFSAGTNGEIFYLNATLAEWLGIDLTSFVPGQLALRDFVAGEGMALIESIRAEPGLNRTATIDLDMLKPGGQGLPVTLVHRVSAAKDGAPGESRTLVLARQDQEGRAQSETSAEMRFTRFFNSTPMAIASVDGDGKILRTNAPFLRLFSGVVSRDDMERGVQFDSVIHENQRPQLREALSAAANNQADISPVDSMRPDNEERHFRYYVNAVIDHAAGEPEEAAIIYAVETTEQKALETQMAHTQKMNAVGTLAGGIAHDFNNVLTAILLSADHLLLSLRSSDSSFADLMEIKRNANRAAVLVRQLLAFSRKQTMRPSVMSMTDVIGDLRMLLDRLTGSNVTLDIEYGRDLWQVKTDLGQFEQVIINLVVNARDAMPDGGKVLISTRNIESEEVGQLQYRGLLKADYVLIEVTDEGTGIAPEVLTQIFEPFFTTKDVGKGTGLGLSMVYGIIKQSGGFIYPISEVGSGTTFQIFLPKYEEGVIVEGEAQAQPVALSETTATGSAPTTKPDQDETPKDLTGGSTVVLLVEDEEAVRRGGKRMLETRGYEVHVAESGVEALEVMEELEGRVDIIVSDVVMPEMDGPSLLREVRKEHPDLKFIFVSGYAEDAFAKNLPEDAKFGFLPKPFSLKQLATAVREMLDA